MAIEIIKERQRITETTYDYVFERRGEKGSGFSFDCDKDGKLKPFTCPEAESNYLKCKNGEIQLGSFTNTCEKCGADYNMSGQHLAPREQWGWDTGESLDEILDIGHTIS